MTKRDPPLVKKAADSPSVDYLIAKWGNRVVQKRALKVGLLNKTTAVIDDGLQPGELVVTEGQYRIQAGSTVDISLIQGNHSANLRSWTAR